MGALCKWRTMIGALALFSGGCSSLETQGGTRAAGTAAGNGSIASDGGTQGGVEVGLAEGAGGLQGLTTGDTPVGAGQALPRSGWVPADAECELERGQCEEDAAFVGLWAIEGLCLRASALRMATRQALGLSSADASCFRAADPSIAINGDLEVGQSASGMPTYAVTIAAHYSVGIRVALDPACLPDGTPGPEAACRALGAPDGYFSEVTCQLTDGACGCSLRASAEVWPGDTESIGDRFYRGEHCVRGDVLHVAADLNGASVMLVGSRQL